MNLSTQSLEEIFDKALIPMVITDSQLEKPGPKIIYVNEAFEKMCGYSKDELIGQTPRILQGEHSDKQMLSELKGALSKGKEFYGSTINYRKDGSSYDVEWTISPIKDDDGNIKYFYSLQKDITYKTQHNIILQTIIDKMHDIIVVTNGETLTFANKAFRRFFKAVSIEEFQETSKCICDKFLEVEGYYFKKTDNEDWIRSLLEKPISQRRVTMMSPDFTPEAFQVDIESFKGNRSIATFQNISHLVAENQKFRKKAYHDTLTGAYNREFIKENLIFIKTKIQKPNIGLVFLDIDFFKKINDTYGHNVGDTILRKLTQKIKKILRLDDYFFRWGGEEFGIICGVSNIDELKLIAEKIRITIQDEVFENVSHMTLSFGITLFKKDEEIQSCLQRADKALYKSKQNGRNMVTVG